MKIFKRLTVALAAVAMMAFALPAVAHTGAVVVTGAADVNDPGTTGVCTADQGLGLPILDDVYACWAISAVGAVGVGVDVHGPQVGTAATLKADGHLIGGCGVSTGVGTGDISVSGAPHQIVVTWPTSAGSVLPVIGRYVGTDTPLVGESDTGAIVAVVQAAASPVTDCAEPTLSGGRGANNFTVNIVGIMAGL